MVELNDEILSAYIDGELDAQTAATVATVLAGNIAMRERLEAMRGADEAMRRAFPLEPASPAALARLQRSSVAPFPSRTKPQRAWAAFSATALAAAAAGFFVAIPVASTMSARTDAPFAVSGALRSVLESAPSGEVRDGARVVVSVKAADGRYCREFERTAGDAVDHGLACRSGAGWSLVALASQPKTSGFETAGVNPAIDAAVDALGATMVEPTDEQALLKRAWAH
jgi:hypothetical protein